MYERQTEMEKQVLRSLKVVTLMAVASAIPRIPNDRIVLCLPVDQDRHQSTVPYRQFHTFPLSNHSDFVGIILTLLENPESRLICRRNRNPILISASALEDNFVN